MTRSDDIRCAVAAVLDAAGYRYRVKRGGKHPYFEVEVVARRERVPFPGSPSDYRSLPNNVAQMRAHVRRWNEEKAEAASSLAADTAPAPSNPLTEINAMGDTTPTKIVSISAMDVPVVEYRGERVVTFTMIDKVHRRPDGTASRTFRENRNRFVEGQDYVAATSAQNDEIRRFGIEVPNRGLMLITRRGYLKLVKPLTDDLSWEVQAEMVDRYFLVEKIAAAMGVDVASIADEVMKRLGGMMKGIVYKQTEDVRAGTELAIEELSKVQADVAFLKANRAAPTFDLSGTVTSDTIIEMAGIARKDRVRGTGALVTHAMLDYCNGTGCFRTPADLNPSRPWRFPREMARAWLTDRHSQGGEVIRAQIARLNAKKGKSGQAALFSIVRPSRGHDGEVA